MSSPARDARLLAIARGFTEVIGRGNSYIRTRNPVTKKCAYDAQVGGCWHYDGNKETDTAWVAGVAPWNYQMVKAQYNLFALSNLASGQVLKCLDPVSKQYVTFQPMALQWTNALDQIQQISMPQSVASQVSDDVLYWPAGYGAGIHIKYVAGTSRLNKLLIIDSAASLPATSYDTLELNFIMAMSSGATPYIDSGSGLAAWDKKTRKDTVKAIEFRLSGGAVVWSFAVPTAYDSLGGSTTGTMRLKKSGNSLYVSVRFPKSWIDAAAFPIMLDPTVDYQVGASADDCSWFENDNYSSTTNYMYFGYLSTGGYNKASAAFRFPAVTIPNDATIDVSYCSFCFASYQGTPPACYLYAEKAANPSAVTSKSDGEGRTKTTANLAITGPTSGGWWNTGSLNTILAELRGLYGYESGAAMQFLTISTGSGSNYSRQLSYNYTGNVSGPKLHIEYTEAATSSWAGTWGG